MPEVLIWNFRDETAKSSKNFYVLPMWIELAPVSACEAEAIRVSYLQDRHR